VQSESRITASAHEQPRRTWAIGLRQREPDGDWARRGGDVGAPVTDRVRQVAWPLHPSDVRTPRVKAALSRRDELLRVLLG
jgi:hypothetical protein